jgi:hypothetical protein
MKNFLTAFIVFMVWSVFGLWIYSWLLPENASAKAEIENTSSIPEILNEEKESLPKIDSSEIIKIDTNKQAVLDTSSTKSKVKSIQLKATNAGGDIIFIFNEGIGISKNKKQVFIPKKSIDYKYKINSYLLEHLDQEVQINSLYSPTESVSNPNLGIKRAYEIEKQLIDVGVGKERIVIKSIIKDINFNKEGNYNSAI